MTASDSGGGSNMIDVALLNRAVAALKKHHATTTQQKEKGQLLGTDEGITLVFGLAKIPARPSSKPIRIDIPHPLHKIRTVSDDDDDAAAADGLEEADVCLIVKEEAKPRVQELVARFPSHLGCIKKVLGLVSLRKKYARYEQRRELLARYDVFLADDRILPMLGKALGKNFFAAKKQPIPINVTRKEALPFAVERSIKSTYMFMPAGTCLGVRVGNTAMPSEHIASNCEAATMAVAQKLLGQWRNILSVSIKTSHSVSLPFYTKSPDELAEVANDVDGTVTGTPESSSSGRKRIRSTSEGSDSDRKSKEAREGTAEDVGKGSKKADSNKSPLLAALKKQKFAGAASEEGAEKKKKEKKVKKQKSAQPATETSNGLETKKSRLSDGDDLNEKEREGGARDAKESKDRKKSKKKKKRKESSSTGPDSELSSEKKVEAKRSKDAKKAAKQAEKDNFPSEEGAKKEKKEKNVKAFIASKNFKGAKRGYIFKKGKEGVGYYIDSPPKVNEVALDALVKKSAGKKRRAHKSGGKHRGRR